MSELQRVIPIAQAVDLRDGDRLVIASIELWSEYLVVRYARPRTDHETGHGHGQGQGQGEAITSWNWDVTDDLGNRYWITGGTWDTNIAIFGHVFFAPAVADDAKILHVHASPMVSDEGIDVALGADRARRSVKGRERMSSASTRR